MIPSTTPDSGNNSEFGIELLLTNIGRKPGVIWNYMHCYYITDENKLRRENWRSDKSTLVNPGISMTVIFTRKDGDTDGPDLPLPEASAAYSNSFLPIKPEKSYANCTYYVTDPSNDNKVRTIKHLYSFV
jgi:hypothetical protein